MFHHLRHYLQDIREARAAAGITLDAARERAKRGAAFLDGVDPGWHARIDATTLELADGAQCVLGQLHGEFRTGLLRSRIWDASSATSLRLFSAASPEDLGFFARADAGEEFAALDYALLNRAWREQVRERAGAAAPQGRAARHAAARQRAQSVKRRSMRRVSG